MSDPGPERKIIVDEDWKSQVQAEKEAALREEQSRQAAAEALPPPDLIFLASTLYLQAMVALGLMADPLRPEQRTVDLVRARHAIDTLQMLQEKTEGNRTAEETEAIEGMLHELRLSYVTVQERSPAAR